jgi:RNA polymerase sigma-70 factor (family 1)
MSAQVSDLTTLVSNIAVNNCEKSYKQLFKILLAPLTKFSYCLLKSREQAEEVASDVLINLWKSRHRLTEIENIRVYSFIAARNLSLNLISKHSKRDIISLDDIEVDMVFDVLTPEQILINDDLKRKLEFAIRALPTRCKLVFKLIKEDGLSYKEVADILNISVKTVDAHLVTAIKKLTLTLRVEFNLA